MNDRSIADRPALLDRAGLYLCSAIVKRAMEEEMDAEKAAIKAGMRKLTRPKGDVDHRRLKVEHGYLLLVPTGKLSDERTKDLLSEDEQKRFTTITAKVRLDLVRNTHGEAAANKLMADIQKLVAAAVGPNSAPNVCGIDLAFDARTAMASLPGDKQDLCLDPDGDHLRTYPNPEGYKRVREDVKAFLSQEASTT